MIGYTAVKVFALRQVYTWSFLNLDSSPRSSCEAIVHCQRLRGGFGSRYHLTVFLQDAHADPEFVEEALEAEFTKHYDVATGRELLLSLSFKGEHVRPGVDRFQCGVFYKCTNVETLIGHAGSNAETGWLPHLPLVQYKGQQLASTNK